VHLYWGDERYVPQRDRRSNFRMFHEAVLQYVHVPLGNIHPIPTHRKDPADAARDYEALLHTHFPGKWARFDGILLGMGKDGHTASLFPGSPALDETERWVMAVEAPAEPPIRLTLTLPVLNAAAHVCFMVSGEEKADTVSRVLNGPRDARAYPAGRICPSSGDLVWCLDRAAAGKLGDTLSDGTPVERIEAGPDA
jgi:6-phosphogluconolactonase